MKSKLSKRIIAYIIDMLLLLLVVSIMQLFLNNTYSETIKAINTSYINGALDFNTYFDKISILYQASDRKNIIIYLINVIYIMLYFVVLPLYNNGSTLGKKIMGIKVEASYNQKLNFLNLFLRNLVINGLLYLVMVILLVYLLPSKTYFVIISITGFIQLTLVIISTFMVLYRKDKRGLHDLLGKTKVVTIK